MMFLHRKEEKYSVGLKEDYVEQKVNQNWKQKIMETLSEVEKIEQNQETGGWWVESLGGGRE